MCDLRRAPKYRKDYTHQQWAKTIGACNKISCRYFLLPWANGKKYMLYVLVYKEKKLMVIDPDGIEEKWKHMPYKKYVRVIIHFCQRYMLAMNIHRPGWNQDIFDWPWTRAEGIAEDKVGY